MIDWIVAVLTSSFCWASADIVFDVILPAETELPQANKTSPHLSHSQTMMLCSLTTYIILFLYMVYISFCGESYLIQLEGKSMLFLNINLFNIGILFISGIFSYYHYYYIIKAFEHSSSTIILPFLQFSSIFAFVFSIITKFLEGNVILSNPLHLVAYILILIGGLAPATDGHIMKIFNREFWNQPFVRFAILADLSHAVYTIFVSKAGDDSSGFTLETNMEFFLLTRIMFIGMFVVQITGSKTMQQDCLQIVHKPNALIIGTMLSEVFTLIGYFSSVYAYQSYYQPGVVSASESSLNLIFNLFLAFILKKYCNIGKQASLQNTALKLAACGTISIGLVIASN